MNPISTALASRAHCNGSCCRGRPCDCEPDLMVPDRADARIGQCPERRAYVTGWRWGALCGLVAGGAIVSAAVLIRLQAGAL